MHPEHRRRLVGWAIAILFCAAFWLALLMLIL